MENFQLGLNENVYQFNYLNRNYSVDVTAEATPGLRTAYMLSLQFKSIDNGSKINSTPVIVRQASLGVDVSKNNVFSKLVLALFNMLTYESCQGMTEATAGQTFYFVYRTMDRDHQEGMSDGYYYIYGVVYSDAAHTAVVAETIELCYSEIEGVMKTQGLEMAREDLVSQLAIIEIKK